MCLINDCTLVLTWSWQEAARYLESFKVYENKPPTSIQEKIDTDYMARLSDVLTSVRSINKTDVSTLAGSFGSLRAIGTASMEELALCPGLGEKKIQRLYHALHVPFKAPHTVTVGAEPSISLSVTWRSHSSLMQDDAWALNGLLGRYRVRLPAPGARPWLRAAALRTLRRARIA